jgi:hypothetical protein
MNPMFSRELVEARAADIDRRVRHAMLVREARLDGPPGRIAGWFAARAIHRGLGGAASQPSRRVVWRDVSAKTGQDAPCRGRDTTAA